MAGQYYEAMEIVNLDNPSKIGLYMTQVNQFEYPFWAIQQNVWGVQPTDRPLYSVGVTNASTR